MGPVHMLPLRREPVMNRAVRSGVLCAPASFVCSPAASAALQTRLSAGNTSTDERHFQFARPA